MGTTTGLALQRITNNCTVTRGGIQAWYRLDPQGWSFGRTRSVSS